MEASDDSSYSVDEKNDCSSSDNDIFCFEGYVNEPEYSKAELLIMSIKSESESSSENFVANIFSQVYFRKQLLRWFSTRRIIRAKRIFFRYEKFARTLF